MSSLGLIIRSEYTRDVNSKSFWISTFVVPLLMVGFGIFVGMLASESDMLKSVASPTTDSDDLTGPQVLSMMISTFLVLFLMIYGAQIFNKVKTEKTNRIMEILATCVPGRTMMIGKVISVGLVGLTQLALWGIIVVGFLLGAVIIFNIDFPFEYLTRWDVWLDLIIAVLFFVGGYIFYGSLYACAGAMTDKDNENQSYMTIITFALLASFYIGGFAIENPDNAITICCSYIPFTATATAITAFISGGLNWWQILLSILTLYGFAALSFMFAGKIYSSAILLKGKKLTPSDILVFLKSK